MSAPADRIRPVLQAISTAFPHKHDALAALAEIERERDSLCAELAATASDRDEIHRALLMTTDERNRGDRELHRLRAQNEELIAERDELRARLAEYEQAPTVAMDDLIQRLRVEPTASQFLRTGDLVESLVAERKEAADRIAALEAEKAEYEREKLKRESQEPVAFRWLGPGKGWRAVYAEPPVSRELEARIRELEAEKAERERQEPVAWQWLTSGHFRKYFPPNDATRKDWRPLYAAPPIPRVEQEPVAWVLFDDIFIAPKDMQDDPPNLECMKPLYAHPLALREPTDDECSKIAIEAGHKLKTEAARIAIGRAMFNAVREVMKK